MTTDQLGELPTDKYWASCEAAQLPDTIRAKALAFRRKLERDGRTDLWMRSEREWYGLDPEGGVANSASVSYGGEGGEQVLIRVNHYRSIGQGILSIAAKERPVFEARAKSTDTSALNQARLGTGLIDAFWRDIGLETVQNEAARMAVMVAEGWTALRWNPALGRVIQKVQRPLLDDGGLPRTETVVAEQVDPLTGEPDLVQIEQPLTEEWGIREGNAEAQMFHPIEVIRDLDTAQLALKWVILPYRENVWDLAARYPERRADLINLKGTTARWPRTPWGDSKWDKAEPDDDMVTVWWLYHLPTDALPAGRQAIVAGDVVVFDGPMELEEIPVYGCIPERESGTASGYSPHWDLLCLCAAYNAIMDVILSSHDALGMQNVIAPDGTKIDPEMISHGLRLIFYTPNPDAPNNGKPEALNLLAIASDSFKLLDILQRLQEVLSGLNSVARGEPMPQLKSGTALALVQSLAVAFNSNLQGEVVRHNERVATGLLKLLQKFAKNKRIAEVTGKTKRSILQEWDRDAINNIQRISVSIAAPIMQTAAGKLQVAEDLLKAGIVKTAAEYLEVLTTGNLEPMYESTLSRVTYLRTENEMMMDGKPAALSIFDDHGMHVREHLGCLDSPEVRQNPAIWQVVNAHVMEHLKFWSTMDPAMALLTGQSVMPLPPPMPMGPPGAPGPAGPPAPPGKGPPPKDGPPEAPKAQPLGQDGGPGMPSLPTPPPLPPV